MRIIHKDMEHPVLLTNVLFTIEKLNKTSIKRVLDDSIVTKLVYIYLENVICDIVDMLDDIE